MEDKKNIQEQIIELGKEDFKSNLQELENFAKYIFKALFEKDKKTGDYSQYWLRDSNKEIKKAQVYYDLFKQVANEGLWLDGKHITIQSTGLSYDYVSLKNKMLIVYPESIVDIQLVYEGDETSFNKENGKIEYLHKLKNPFTKVDKDIIGGYCVIKNKRGEFLTTQTRGDFDIAKQSARGGFIWDKFYAAMCLKTLMKRGCKMHFSDIYDKIEEEDNKGYDLEQLRTEDIKDKTQDLMNKYIK